MSHAAFDHFGDTAEILRRSGARVMCGMDSWDLLRQKYPDISPDRRIGTAYGDKRTFGKTVIRTVQAWHGTGTEHHGVVHAADPYGFIVMIEPGVTYYHTGDTCLFSDMKMLRDLYAPNVMTVGISKVFKQYSCEMTPREAAIAVAWCGADVAVPCHYAPGDPAYDEFMELVKVFAPRAVIRPQINVPFEYVPFKVIDGAEKEDRS